jgi:transposase-like protein
MTRAFSITFKRKMVERLTGKNALNPSQLARETGIRQQNLCRWLDEARSLPLVAFHKRIAREWTVEQKARIVAEASKLTGDQLVVFLESEGVKLAHFERWRLALEEDGQGSNATTRRIRKLERELARKEKALAEAATLLVLKKTIDSYYQEEDDDTDVPNEK